MGNSKPAVRKILKQTVIIPAVPARVGVMRNWLMTAKVLFRSDRQGVVFHRNGQFFF